MLAPLLSSWLNIDSRTGGPHKGDSMTTYYDVPGDLLIGSLSAELQSFGQIILQNGQNTLKQVLTGHQLRKLVVYFSGCIKESRMKGQLSHGSVFGGPKDRGVKPTRAAADLEERC